MNECHDRIQRMNVIVELQPTKRQIAYLNYLERTYAIRINYIEIESMVDASNKITKILDAIKNGIVTKRKVGVSNERKVESSGNSVTEGCGNSIASNGTVDTPPKRKGRRSVSKDTKVDSGDNKRIRRGKKKAS